VFSADLPHWRPRQSAICGQWPSAFKHSVSRTASLPRNEGYCDEQAGSGTYSHSTVAPAKRKRAVCHRLPAGCSNIVRSSGGAVRRGRRDEVPGGFRHRGFSARTPCLPPAAQPQVQLREHQQGADGHKCCADWSLDKHRHIAA